MPHSSSRSSSANDNENQRLRHTESVPFGLHSLNEKEAAAATAEFPTLIALIEMLRPQTQTETDTH